MYYEVLTMTEMINEIVKIDKKYKRSILYRMLKEEVYSIYKKVRRKEKRNGFKKDV